MNDKLIEDEKLKQERRVNVAYKALDLFFLKISLDVLKSALKNDPDYRKTWEANIAMSYVDAEKAYRETNGKTVLNHADKVAVANLAAENFLTLLCA